MSCPVPSRSLFDLLDANAQGIALTDNYAMTPAAAVSGLICQHPSSRYFSLLILFGGLSEGAVVGEVGGRVGLRAAHRAAPPPRLDPPPHKLRADLAVDLGAQVDRAGEDGPQVRARLGGDRSPVCHKVFAGSGGLAGTLPYERPDTRMVRQ